MYNKIRTNLCDNRSFSLSIPEVGKSSGGWAGSHLMSSTVEEKIRDTCPAHASLCTAKKLEKLY